MPTASVVVMPAQKCLHKAHERIMRGFSSLTGGQDRWLVRRPQNPFVRFG